jgi:hypothetical protein
MNFEAGTLPTSFAEARLGEKIPPKARAPAPAPVFFRKSRLEIPLFFFFASFMVFPPFFDPAIEITCTRLL